MARIHVLLVDDDPIMLQLFGGLLARRGFEVLYAHDGAEGWEMARKTKPELIMLDYRMPGMDGMETAQHLKEDSPETRDVPIVMLSSEDFSPDAQKALKEIGVEDYIHKGQPPEEIIARVKAVLKKRGIDYQEPEEDV
jgi:DNA-binding response OmpR family regulator